MIGIITTAYNELTTELVMEELISRDFPVMRLNCQDLFGDNEVLDVYNLREFVKNYFNTNQVLFWYRRYGKPKVINSTFEFSIDIQKQLDNEHKTLFTYFMNSFEDKLRRIFEQIRGIRDDAARVWETRGLSSRMVSYYVRRGRETRE